MTAEQPLLEVRGVARSFRRNRVLRDVNLEVRPGELVGIVGENGSGKTTLLRILVGLLGPDRGETLRHGTTGYCPQEPQVFERLTVDENFSWFATAYGLTGWTEARDTLLQRYRFERWRTEPVSKVSGGTKQKLNLCLALLRDPDLLLLDEPYSGFDWETYTRFWEHAAELRAAGHGLLVVSHFLYERERFDRIYELEDGVVR
jgi:ABC-2 type transport system ATP-binding protein